MDTEILKFFEFLKIVEKLKTELRHSWTSNTNRQESVAEHTWMFSLIVMALGEKLDKKIDLLKAMKMAVCHDLVEAIAGDIPSHELSIRQESKPENEKQAIEKLKNIAGGKLGQEIYDLWTEFEERKSYEAKFVYSIDKLECIIEHNITDIKTWDDGDYRYTLNEIQDTPFDFDNYMRRVKDRLNDWTYKKASDARTVDKIPQINLQRYFKRKDELKSSSKSAK